MKHLIIILLGLFTLSSCHKTNIQQVKLYAVLTYVKNDVGFDGKMIYQGNVVGTVDMPELNALQVVMMTGSYPLDQVANLNLTFDIKYLRGSDIVTLTLYYWDQNNKLIPLKNVTFPEPGTTSVNL